WWRTRRPMGHAWRSLFGGASLFLHFAALALVPLAEVSAINYLVPLMIVALAAFVLKERIWGARLVAVLVGLAGAALIVAPKLGQGLPTGGEGLGVLLVLSSTILTAAAMIQIRRLSETEQTGTIVLYFSLTVMVASLTTIPFGWVMTSVDQLLRLVAIGLIGGVAQILMTESYARADASFIAPFEYTGILWSISLGLILFAEVPAWITLAGAAIVLAASASLAWSERRSHR
ncbi:MAG: DMT family transporter, partial [Alphaproteobacteria bacterium]|nr:DMT family transporter [Alphaproteobacteria bacterium]